MNEKNIADAVAELKRQGIDDGVVNEIDTHLRTVHTIEPIISSTIKELKLRGIGIDVRGSTVFERKTNLIHDISNEINTVSIEVEPIVKKRDWLKRRRKNFKELQPEWGAEGPGIWIGGAPEYNREIHGTPWKQYVCPVCGGDVTPTDISKRLEINKKEDGKLKKQEDDLQQRAWELTVLKKDVERGHRLNENDLIGVGEDYVSPNFYLANHQKGGIT